MSVFSELWTSLRKPKGYDLKGSIDGIFSGALSGWVYAGDGRRLNIIVKKNSDTLGECIAGKPRLDLVAHGFGDGAHGFLLPVPPDLGVQPGDVIDVVDSADQTHKLTLKITPRVFRNTMGAGVVTPVKISGWVCLPWQPERLVTVRVLLDEKIIAEGSVNRYLANVPGVGHGRLGFSIPLSISQDASTILPRLVLRCVETGRNVPISAEATIPGRLQFDTNHGGVSKTTRSLTEPGSPPERLLSRHEPRPARGREWSDETVQLNALRAEVERLRALIEEQESEIEMNLIQLRSVQEELEYWFCRYLELKEKTEL